MMMIKYYIYKKNISKKKSQYLNVPVKVFIHKTDILGAIMLVIVSEIARRNENKKCFLFILCPQMYLFVDIFV